MGLSKSTKMDREAKQLPRCFAALEVAAPSVRRALEGAQAELRRAFGMPDPVKWVPSHQFHFTLKFLGEIPDEAVQRALAALGRAAAVCSPFTLGVAGLGAFPAPERPSVLWAGVTDGREPLAALAASVEREMAAEGFPPERRRFQPHLTLGRVREGARAPAAVAQVLQAAAGRGYGSWRAERIVLFQSELTPRGPIYSVLDAAVLREEND